MIKSNFHTHTTYCDGKNTAEEMVLQAISLGFDELGFSGHGYMTFDPSWCMTPEGTELYIKEVNALKEKYRDRIRIFTGTELDYYGEITVYPYDFTLGSVHYIKMGEEYLPVDSSAAAQKDAADRYFGGSLIAYAEKYFELVGDVAEKLHPSMVGHFDLVSKFNEGNCLYDSYDKRYVKAWKEAADRLCKVGIPFEINTGAMARGLRTMPYPAPEMIAFISQRGGRFVINSDCHYKEKLDWAFEETEKMFPSIEIINRK